MWVWAWDYTHMYSVIIACYSSLLVLLINSPLSSLSKIIFQHWAWWLCSDWEWWRGEGVCWLLWSSATGLWCYCSAPYQRLPWLPRIVTRYAYTCPHLLLYLYHWILTLYIYYFSFHCTWFMIQTWLDSRLVPSYSWSRFRLYSCIRRFCVLSWLWTWHQHVHNNHNSF